MSEEKGSQPRDPGWTWTLPIHLAPAGADAPYEFAALAFYNSECSRGVMHTPAWQEMMRFEQERFNAQQMAELESQGIVVPLASGGVLILPPGTSEASVRAIQDAIGDLP